MQVIYYIYIWVFPKIGVPQNGWFIRETLLKWMIWGENPLFSETPIYMMLKPSNVAAFPTPSPRYSMIDTPSHWVVAMRGSAHGIENRSKPQVFSWRDIGVSKNSGFSPQNHPIFIGISMDFHDFHWSILGENPLFFGNTHIFTWSFTWFHLKIFNPWKKGDSPYWKHLEHHHSQVNMF